MRGRRYGQVLRERHKASATDSFIAVWAEASIDGRAGPVAFRAKDATGPPCDRGDAGGGPLRFEASMADAYCETRSADLMESARRAPMDARAVHR